MVVTEVCRVGTVSAGAQAARNIAVRINMLSRLIIDLTSSTMVNVAAFEGQGISWWLMASSSDTSAMGLHYNSSDVGYERLNSRRQKKISVKSGGARRSRCDF